MLTTAPTAVADTDLLERGSLLDALQQHLAAVTAEDVGRFVLVGGEAGVGKTALVKTFGATQNIPVWWGSCDALTMPNPFGPVRDVAAVVGGNLERVLADGGRPYEVADALMQALRQQQSSILVLDDLHWADDATLDVLRLLIGRIGTVPTLVIGTYRDDQLARAHPLRLLSGELSTRIRRMNVAPLSEAAVAQLAAPRHVDSQQLYRSTGGNPFFVTEVLEADGGGVPRTVQDAVLARVGRLSATARRLVETVAVVPAGAELELLDEMDHDAIGSVEESLTSGVLVASGRRIRFRHDIARVAIERSLPPPVRVALHQAALAALPDTTDPARLAHHAEGAQDAGAVLRWAPVAGAAAASVGSHRESAGQYARALRFGQPLEDGARAELLSLLSAECHLTGDYGRAIETRQEAIATYSQLNDPLREGDGFRALSSNLRCAGRVSEAHHAGESALRLLEPFASRPELAMAYANRAMLALNVEDAEQTRLWAAQAMQLAERLDLPECFVHAMNSAGTADYLFGDDDGRRQLERSLDLCLEHGMAEQAGRAYINLAWASVRLHDYRRAEAYQAAGIEYCLDRGLDAWRYEILGHQARRLLDQGGWGKADDATATILRSPRTNTVAHTLALALVAVLRVRRGDPDPQGPLADAAVLAAQTGEMQSLLPVALARVEMAWLTGVSDRTAAADEATQDALELARRHHIGPALGQLMAWRRRCGIREEAPVGAVGPTALELAGDTAAAAAAWLDLGCAYESAVVLAGGSEDQQRAALAAFQELDMRPAAARVARDLRRSGARGLPRGPRASTRHNAGGLTSREVEVLGLIGQNLRNREIAQQLHLSEKTVDHHVSAILTKLGVGTRGQAVKAAAELGVTAGP